MTIDYQKLYEQLGYLFYAIAEADEKVRPVEIETLKELIASEWISLEDSTDEFGTDAANYIFISFDYLLSERISSGEAYRVFEQYYNEHKAAFTVSLKRKILAAARSIANAFGGKNKKENDYIKNLERLLKHRDKN